jgi:NifU-like protein
MGQEALEKAIEDYRGRGPSSVKTAAGRQGLGVRGQLKKEGEIICKCFNVTDKEIERAVRDHHLTTVEEVTNYTKAGGGCGGCHDQIREIIARITGQPVPVQTKPQTEGMTIVQKIKKIEETLSKEIRPALQADGGDIELIDVQGNTVIVRLRGACAGCAMAQATLKNYVESQIQTHVSSDLVVEEA